MLLNNNNNGCSCLDQRLKGNLSIKEYDAAFKSIVSCICAYHIRSHCGHTMTIVHNNSHFRPVTPMTPQPQPFGGITYGRPSMPTPRPPPSALPSQYQQPATPEPIEEEEEMMPTPPEYHRQWRRDAEKMVLINGEAGKENNKKNKMETRYRPVNEVGRVRFLSF